MAQEPDSEARAVIEQAGQRLFPPAQALTPTSARERLERVFATQPAEDVATVDEFAIPGPGGDLPIRVYEPDADPPYPALLYLHGGGFVAGSLDTHDTVCAALTNRANCLTVSVDYRLAPEHPFPAAVEDAVAALEWLSAHGHHLDVDTDRIAVAGDSAGGNLTAATCLLVRDQSGPAVRRQVMFYPAVASHHVHEFDSWEENGEGYLLEWAGTQWYLDHYVDSRVAWGNPYFAPLVADDLTGLPPATIVTAGFDLHRDEGLAFGDRLAAAGVPVEQRHYERMIHGFVSLPDVITTGMDAIQAAAGDLRSAFAE